MKKILSSILLSLTLLAIASCAHSKQNPITANKSVKDSVENCADNNLNNTQIPVYARRLIPNRKCDMLATVYAFLMEPQSSMMTKKIRISLKC